MPVHAVAEDFHMYSLYIMGIGKIMKALQNGKVRSQEIPAVTEKFGLGVQNKAGQRLTEFCQENALVIANTLFQEHKRRLYT